MVLFLNIGCLSAYTKSVMRSTQVPNWIYIHSNPEAGDFAVHRTAQGADVRYLVHSVSERGIEISQRFVSTGILLGSGLGDVEYRLFVDARGYVQEAYLIEDDGRRTRLPIASPGQNGYVADVSDVQFPASELMHVEAGYFAITDLRFFRLFSLGALGPMEITIIHYGNPTVPFGIVSVEGYSSTEVSFTDLAALVDDAGTGLALDVVLHFLDAKYNRIGAELIKHGNDTSLIR